MRPASATRFSPVVIILAIILPVLTGACIITAKPSAATEPIDSVAALSAGAGAHDAPAAAPADHLATQLSSVWQHVNLQDTTVGNQAAIEQRLASYLGILHHADSVTASGSVRRFLDRCFGQPGLRRYYTFLLEHYLADPNSPHRDDVVYAHFLRQMLPFYTDAEQAERERTAFRLALVSKNQPGTIAADFSFTDRQGRTRKLSDVRADRILLLFFDPDCAECQFVLPHLVADTLLQRPRLTVLAVNPDATPSAWPRHRYQFPANWIDACCPNSAIRSRLLYHLPALPSLYLLDAERRVILKDAKPQAVLKAL